MRSAELLGGRVERRERRDRARGLRELAARRLHDLGDSEVEHLHEHVLGAKLSQDEDVAGLDVAVRDSLAVHDVEGERDRLEDPHRAREGERADVFEDALERAAVEPLEDQVRNPGAVLGSEVADVPRLDDRRAAPRELREEGPLLDELFDELRPLRRRHMSENPEALERHGLLPNLVDGPVDDPEAPFGDDALDLVLARDRGAHDAERVVDARRTTHLASPSPSGARKRAPRRRTPADRSAGEERSSGS